jgi:hypothetical protein
VRLTPRGGIYIGEAAAAEWLAAREQAPTAAIPSPRMVVARVAGRQRGGDISDLLPPPARRRLQ